MDESVLWGCDEGFAPLCKRAVLRRRAARVEELYAKSPSCRVIM